MKAHLLMARQRSGTGALGSLIDQHPEIRYLGELFHPNEADREENYFNFLLKKIKEDPNRALPGASTQNYEEFMSFIGSRSEDAKKNIFIDIKYNSTHHFNDFWHPPLETPNLIHLCKRDRRKILHLKRRNYLKTYLSGLLAEKNKVWHANSTDAIKITSIAIDPNAALAHLRLTTQQVGQYDGFLEKYPDVLTLEYENLFQPSGMLTAEVAQQLAGFLEVDATPFNEIKPYFIKQASDDLTQVIENYDQVEKALKNTIFSWMLIA